MKKQIFLIIAGLFFCQVAFSYTNSVIKLAIFDNPRPDISFSQAPRDLTEAYMAGVNTAVYVAETKKINIQPKYFFHSDNVLEIMNKASEVKTWRPDVIIGFHASNDFLMGTIFFGDQLILSIAASDPRIKTLPANFYSLGTPDSMESNVIIRFIKQHYGNPGIFITVAAESKETIDFSNLLINSYKGKNADINISRYLFLTEDMNIVNMNDFMADYKNNNIIVVMPSGFLSGIKLMNKIAQYLLPQKPIFVTASDNWGDDSIPQIVKSNYDAFRIDTIAGSENSREYKVFAENFEKIYHRPPKYKISFITYRAVMSVVAAIKQYPAPQDLTTTQAVLWSYQQALKHNPNWFRPDQYIVYKLTPTKEVYFETLEPNNSSR